MPRYSCAEDKQREFAELFCDAMESWFSADIACCDSCYDDFVAMWPGAYFLSGDFQRSGIPLDCFYSGSRLAEEFTKDEFQAYLGSLACPRCGERLEANVWPYNLPFDMPENFEEHAAEIAAIARRTPFLMLTHPFAQGVKEAVDKAVDKSAIEQVGVCFRGRIPASLRSRSQTEFGPPPPSRAAEGRFNHLGQPVLYLADGPGTVLWELDRPKGGVLVAEVRITRPLKVLDLLPGSLLNDTIASLVYSSLLSAPAQGKGWDQPAYVFSRFVADCAVSSGANAIRYPSVKTGKGHNLVVLDIDGKNQDAYRVGPIRACHDARLAAARAQTRP